MTEIEKYLAKNYNAGGCLLQELKAVVATVECIGALLSDECEKSDVPRLMVKTANELYRMADRIRANSDVLSESLNESLIQKGNEQWQPQNKKHS